MFEAAGEVLAAVRKEKSEQKRSLMTPVDARRRARHRASGSRRSPRAEADLCEAGKIAKLDDRGRRRLSVEVELAPPDAA